MLKGLRLIEIRGDSNFRAPDLNWINFSGGADITTYQEFWILVRQRFGVVQDRADGVSQLILDDRLHDKLVDSHRQGFFLGDVFIKSGAQDDGNLRVMVSENVEVNIVADGRNIFQNAANGGINIFDELKNLIDGLENPDPVAGSAQVEATIKPLQDGRDQINSRRSEYAPVLYRLQATDEYMTNLRPKVEEAMAKLEQADITKAVVELQSLELAYETTIATAGRIIQPSLLDFLR